MSYQLTDGGVIRLSDGAVVPDNPTLADWQEYQDWVAAGNTAADAPAPPAVPNWIGFNGTFLYDPNLTTIAQQFSSPAIYPGLVAAAATANVGALTIAYGLAVSDLAAQSITIDQPVLDSWQAIADANNIPITLNA